MNPDAYPDDSYFSISGRMSFAEKARERALDLASASSAHMCEIDKRFHLEVDVWISGNQVPLLVCPAHLEQLQVFKERNV